VDRKGLVRKTPGGKKTVRVSEKPTVPKKNKCSRLLSLFGAEKEEHDADGGRDEAKGGAGKKEREASFKQRTAILGGLAKAHREPPRKTKTGNGRRTKQSCLNPFVKRKKRKDYRRHAKKRLDGKEKGERRAPR